jgi:apolipoprotein N-acyltransferase
MARAPLRVIALSLAAGAAGALAFPPFGILPGIAGFGLLMRLLDDSRAVGDRRAALIGWLAGLSYFLISTWWVGEAFLVDVAAHGWQAPFAVLLLGGGLGLIWSAAALVYRRIAPSSGARLLVFAFVFSGAEWLRGHILTGFPWDLPGEVFRAGSALSQGAAVFGAYGMTFLTLLIGGSAGLIGWPLPRGDRVGLALGATVFLALYGWGALRLSSALPLGREADGVRVRIVQADIPQTEKWSQEALQSIVLNYTSLTAAPAPRQPDVVIWPEGAVPLTVNDLMSPEAWTSQAVLGALRPGQFLVFGSTRLEPAPSSGGRPRYFNSLIAMRRTATGAERVGVYDKHHLVPFGEYMPFDALSTRLGLKALAHVYDGFTSGPRPEPLETPVLGRFQPLICYESLFPSTFALSGARPEWIVNVSNDAWFGDTSGPWQHLNLASYRAIEEGLPLVRATPTGVSAMIDGYGRPLAELPIGRRGVLDIGLPKALPPTLYTRWRDWPFLAFLIIGALGAVVKPRTRLASPR